MSPNRDFGATPLPVVIATLHEEQSSGNLRVKNADSTREFLLVDGELRAARSSAEDEMLGSWLVVRGLLSEEFKQLSLLKQEGSDPAPLGHLLISRGALTPEELERELHELALSILRRACTDECRDCRFHPGPRQGQLDTLPQTTTAQLILIAARAMHGALDLQRAALGSPAQVATRHANLDLLVNEYELSNHESILLGKLNRDRPLFELRAVSGLEREDFYTAAYALLVAGVIRLEDPPSAAPTTRPSSGRAIHEASVRISEGLKAERASIANLSPQVSHLNHYALLELPVEASYQKIFDAWNSFQEYYNPKRAQEAHLKGLEAQLERIFSHGQEAFEVLSSPERRPHYDRMIRAAEEKSSGGTRAVNTSTAASDRGVTVAENLARVDALTRKGDIFSAVKLMERICDLEPKPVHLLRLARLMLRNPQWTNRAMERLRRAVEIDPGFVEGWLEVAEFWRRKGSRERQRKALERALAQQPEHQEAAASYRTLVGEADCQLFLERVKAYLAARERAQSEQKSE